MPEEKRIVKVGDTLGRWRIEQKLGGGGNGEVWRATSNDGRTAALKVLSKVTATAYRRFADEISVMSGCLLPGVVPIIDSYLPSEAQRKLAWYAMPIATPLEKHLRGSTVEEKVHAISKIAHTLASLHDDDIVHRDVKPANMLHLDGEPRLADFGLVTYPTKARVTRTRETVGPRATMAPEARRGNSKLDLKATDVYSLAKSLWILLSGNTAGFDGQYSRDHTVSIRPFTGSLFIDPLELAIERSTAHDPTQRPAMRELERMLLEWLSLNRNWDLRNLAEWPSKIGRLFPTIVPEFASWRGKVDILRVLGFLASHDGLNHMFIPSGGGLDLTDVVESAREGGCIELRCSRQALLLKPRMLEFYHIIESPRWSYFLLHADALSPSGVAGAAPVDGQEIVTELPSGEYVDPMAWDRDEWNGKELPTGTRQISRFLAGTFAFFQKSSPYNMIGPTYDARHSNLDPRKFLAHVRALRDAVGDSQDEVEVTQLVRSRPDLWDPL